MGNQGMTNWKFSMFFVIALTLVAGLFADTAIAGSGDGRMTVAITDATNIVDTPRVLVAGSTATLTFTYTATVDNNTAATDDLSDDDPINMNGGRVRLNIPADWKFGVDKITSITDGSGENINLYLSDARLRGGDQTNPTNTIKGPINKNARDRRRVYLSYDDKDNVTRIEVELHPTEWNVDRSTAARALTITVTGVTVPIPTRLGRSGIPFQGYWFGASSAAAEGSFSNLRPYTLVTNNPNNLPTDPRPIVRVGNITSGPTAIKIEATPATSYVGDKGNYVVKLTAKGPIYDVDQDGDGTLDINAQIVLTLPTTTTLKSTSTADSPPAIPNTNIGTSGYVSVRGVKGVTPVRPDVQIVGQNVTINFRTMDKDGVIELTYHNVEVAAATSGDTKLFNGTVISHTSSAASFGGAGTTKVRQGSGTVKINTSAVEVDTYQSSITITYTATTDIPASDTNNAYLVVQIPTGAFKMPNRPTDDTVFIPLVLRHGNDKRANEHASSPYGDVTPYKGSITADLLGDSNNAIVWGPLKLKKNGTFVGTISRVRITDTTGTYNWKAHLTIGANRPTSVPSDGAASEIKVAPLYVLQAEQNPLDPDVTFEITEAKELPLSTQGASILLRTAGAGGFGYYDAAGRYRLTFKFTAKRTPLKEGTVTVKLPDDWSPPKTDKKTLGYTKITYTKGDDAAKPDPATPKLTVSGQKITISNLDLDRVGSVYDVTDAPDNITIVYGEATNPDDAETDDMRGALSQPDAGDEVIKTTFDVDGDGGIGSSPSNEVPLIVGNAPKGSGTATIRPFRVEAGSVVSLNVVYKAAGTMDGGRVALQMPAGWGDLRKSDGSKAKNQVQVTSSGGTIDDNEWFTSEDVVDVSLKKFGKGNTVRFALTNVVAQPSNLGVANFRIYSTGKGGEAVGLVVGEDWKSTGAYTNAGADLSKLLGRVYTTDCLDIAATPNVREDFNGFLRVAVTGGGDGSGEVKVDIVASENSGKYMIINDAGDEVEVTDNMLHAGDGAKTHLRFTYTPVETIIDGQLKFSVPSDWADPQTSSPSTTGFTQVDSDGRIGIPDDSGDGVTIPIQVITRDNTITIDYGADNGGVTPPTSAGEETFTFAVKGSADGRLKPLPHLNQPTVPIRPQATGKGTAKVVKEGTLTAGSTENSVTITYTSVGQVVDGDLKITVPENWSPAISDHFDISGSGTVVYGGSMTDAQRADDDPVDNHISNDAKVGSRELIIPGIDLKAGEAYTVTYKDVTVQPTAATGVAFKIEFRGGAGPGTGFGAVGTPEDEDDAQKVDVESVAPGSGTVEVRGPTVVTAGLTAYEISIIYTADAQIVKDKVIAVQIPEGWSDPIDADRAMDDDGNYNVGTYTVVHKKADGTSFPDPYNDPTDGHVEKTAVANRKLMATVTGDGIAANETVTFTYQNATAPSTAVTSTFQVYYDGAMVASNDDTVVVQSAEGVTKLALSSEENTFFIDNNGTLTVTVMLQATDDSAARRLVDTTVTLTGATTGSFNPETIIIPAGETMGTSDYSDGSVGSVEITASTDATGIADAAPLAIIANTENPMLQTVGFSVNDDPESKVAKDLDTITVTATGTLFQTVTFMIENVNFSGISMTDPDNDGTYTGDHRLARGSAEGMHSVTVTMVGASKGKATDDKLTIDNTLPVVEAIASSKADTITITATVTDATAVTVAAAVSMQGSEAEADSVMLSADATDSTKYTGTHKVIDGVYDITVKATDAAGNKNAEGTGMATVTVDNAAPDITITAPSADMSVMAGDSVTISATVTDTDAVKLVKADASGLDAGSSEVELMAAESSDMYSGTVTVTAEGNASVTITITAEDNAGNQATPATVMVTLDNDAPVITDSLAAPSSVMTNASVTISATVTDADAVKSVKADASGLDAGSSEVELMAAESSDMYSGTVMVTAEGNASVTITITAEDNAGNQATSAPVMVTLDNIPPTVTASDVEGKVRNGQEVTISAEAGDGTGSGIDSVMANLSALDTAADPAEVELMDDDDDGTYTYTHTISEANEAENGTYAVTVTATDMAGNEASDDAMVTLQNTLFYTSTLPAGISLYHVPLDVEGLDTVGDLAEKLQNENLLLTTTDGSSWSRDSSVAITDDLGILVSLSAEETFTLEGKAWGEGTSMISLQAGQNLIGLPVNDDRVTNVSDIKGLFDEGVVGRVIVSSGASKFDVVAAAGDAADGPVAGDAAYLVIVNSAASATVTGDGWENGEAAGAAPIALAGYTVDNQTPVLDVRGSVVDEITGLTKEGFRVKVKNLSTKAALSEVTSVEAADGYNIIFVDLNDAHAARVGDVLEISADSPDPLIGVQPVRHVVTVDDVKSNRILLENLIAYEIPAETALLNNYPNPFNPETWIPYHLSEDADVKLTIYDINGEVVRDIDVGHQTAAKYDTRSKAIYWDGRNRFGEQVASGIYFYHLQAGDFSGTRKMVILK